MKRISKRVREEAALICAIAASRGEPISITSVASLIHGIDVVAAVRKKTAKLAVKAWAVAHEGFDAGSYGFEAIRDEYAEAEALLRTGWTP